MEIINKGLNNFAILDEEKRIVGGMFGDDSVDNDGDIIFKDDYIEAIAEFAKWGNIRDSHNEAIGKLLEIGTKTWNYLEVHISDDNVWKKIKDGVYNGFSVGLRVDTVTNIPISQIDSSKMTNLPKAVKIRIKRLGYVRRIVGFYIGEISITDRPKNPNAIITIIKSEVNMNDLQNEQSQDAPEIETTENQVSEVNNELVVEVENTNEVVVKNEVVENTVTNEVVINKGELISLNESLILMKSMLAELESYKTTFAEQIAGFKSELELAKSEIASIKPVADVPQDALKSIISETMTELFKTNADEMSPVRKGHVNAETEVIVNAEIGYKDIASMIAKQYNGG